MLVFRKITRELIEQTIKNPDDQKDSRESKSVLYKNFGKNYLKVVIAKEEDKVVVITEHWIAKMRLKK